MSVLPSYNNLAGLLNRNYTAISSLGVGTTVCIQSHGNPAARVNSKLVTANPADAYILVLHVLAIVQCFTFTPFNTIITNNNIQLDSITSIALIPGISCINL